MLRHKQPLLCHLEASSGEELMPVLDVAGQSTMLKRCGPWGENGTKFVLTVVSKNNFVNIEHYIT